MARISGVDLPRTKRIEVGLTYIFGIGRHRSNVILTAAGVSPDVRVKDLTEDGCRVLTLSPDAASFDGRDATAVG